MALEELTWAKHVSAFLHTKLQGKPYHHHVLHTLSLTHYVHPSKVPNQACADQSGGDKDKDCKAVDGDCPICFEEMEAGPGKEGLVWCKAACGQNIHSECFNMWATTKRQGGDIGAGKVTCPYCRSDWEFDHDAVNIANIKRGVPNEEGYVNVADQLGISTQRDYSSYSRFWSGHPEHYGRRYRGRQWED